LNQLEVFVAEEFPEVEGPNQSKRWVKALLRVVITDEERSWVKAHIVKPGLNWAAAKLKFCQGFTRVVNFLAAAQELSDLRQTNKAVTIHSERFEDHLKEALIVPGDGESVPFDTAQREPIYSLTYLRSLNKKLGQAVMSDRRIREVTDLKSLIVLTRKIEEESAAGGFYQSLSNDRSASIVDSSDAASQRATRKRKSRRDRDHKSVHCARCGRSNHSESECRASYYADGQPLEALATKTVSSVKKERRNSLSHIQCRKCKEYGHFADRCTNARVNRVQLTAEADDGIVEPREPLNDILAPVLLLPQATGDDSNVAVRKLATVDSGAQTSLIALHVVREMRLDSHVDKSKSRSIIPYGSSRRVSTIGKLLLKLLCGRHAVTHEFDVMMAKDDVILGMDILPSVGISITGVPTDFPLEDLENQIESACSQQDESNMRSKPSPFQLEERIDGQEVSTLMDGIQDLLDDNIALDPASLPV
jgi:hypothetical protein